MKRSPGEFRQPTSAFGTRKGKEEEYLDMIIRHILGAGLSRFSPPPDAWMRMLRRLKSETYLPSNCEEVTNGFAE